jgi:DNA polymerase-3 subunit delta'
MRTEEVGGLPFSSILGQEPAVETLRRALSTGRVHPAYRFEGPDGVGKEKAALELAVRLVCPESPPEVCSACWQRVTTFSPAPPRVPLHPDVVLVERGLYQGVIGSSEATGISVEQVRRVVLARMGFPPHEGHALVVIVRDADQLTPQAANALLKALEEPSGATYFVLLTSRPKRLLDTILSRTLPVRFGPLSEDVLGSILLGRGLCQDGVARAEGSAALALKLAEESVLSARLDFAEQVRKAVAAPDMTQALDLSESRPSERGSLAELLSFFALECARSARTELIEHGDRAERLARWHAIALQALRELEWNVAPALVIESMVLRLRRT